MLMHLARRQFVSLWRRNDWRALLFAMLMMSLLLSLLSLTAERLADSLRVSGARMLGADLIISASRPFSPHLLAKVENSGARISQVTQFTTMLNHQEQLLLVSVRAVTAPYPLRGQLSATPASALPEPGQIWAEASVLQRLGVKVGESLAVGYLPLQISAQVADGPDRGSGFNRFSPQVIMRAEDLAATQVLVPGSRAEYRLLISTQPQQLATLKAQLQAELTEDQRLLAADTDQPGSANALSNTSRYLKLGSLMTLLIGSFSIYLSLARFSLSQQSRSALLLSLGLSRRQLLGLYGLLLLAAWLVSTLPGIALGYLLHTLLLQSLTDLLPQPLPSLSWLALLSPLPVLAVLLSGLGLTTLLPLGKVSVLRLLRQYDDQPVTSSQAVLALVLSLALVIGLFLPSPWLAMLLALGLLLTGVVAGLLVRLLIRLLYGIYRRCGTPLALLTLRIQQQARWHRLQGGVLALLLALMSITLFTREDMLAQWRAQLPANTPNQFVINVQPWQVEPLQQWFAQAAIEADLYPLIRGRLEAINTIALEQALTQEQHRHNTVNRELNLTWQAQPPAHNPLVAGQWRQQPHSLSVERSMAQALDLSLGDQLTFRAGSETFTGQIDNLREVNWRSFQPNFYVIFTPGVIDQLPATYMTSFYLPPQRQALAGELLAEFPTLTLIDVNSLLQQAQTLIRTLSDSASLIMLLTLLSGLVLLLITLQQNLQRRRFQAALLRVLGASARQTRQLDLLEFLLVGISCGLVAALFSEIGLWLIYQNWLALAFKWHPLLWLMLPLVSALLFGLSGYLSQRPVPLAQDYARLRSQT